ncbi:MAG: putative lipid II flippase MurJ [Chlamydiae bacterium]|nr:putative lipid II flippase MurJ [Chlamydiota bacterium]
MSGTLISKLSGVLREMTMAFFFGADALIASFTVAYRISHFFRRFFAESGLGVSFIPYYESAKLKTQDRGKYFFRDLIISTLGILSVFILLSEGTLRLLIYLNISSEWTFIFQLSCILIPCIGLITLFALNQGLLQSESRFFLPAVSNIFLNFVWIGAMVLTFSHSRVFAVYVLSFAVLFGFFLQWLFTFIPVYRICKLDIKQGLLHEWGVHFKDIKKVFKSLSIAIVGVGSLQVNAVVDAILAKIADPRGPAYLWYSIKLYQLPLSLFAISIASALLPSLSQAFCKKDTETYKFYLKEAIKKSLYLIIPCTFCFFPLGFFGIELIYGRGKFDLVTSYQVTHCLYAYGLGLPFASLNVILTNAFYAKKEYKTPSVFALLSVLLNLILNALFVFYFKLGAISIAFSTSLSSLFLMVFLCLKTQEKLFDVRIIIKTLITSCLSMILTYRMLFIANYFLQRTLLLQIAKFAFFGMVFFGLYLIFDKLFDKLSNHFGRVSE